MPLPAPPIRGSETTPAALNAVNRRIYAQENPVLPEPRTYYAKNTASITTSGTARSTVLTVPIFWRPGNLLRVMFKNDHTSSGALTANFIMDGSPYGNAVPIPIVATFTPVVFAAYGTVVTQSDGSFQYMSALNPFAIQWQEWVPYVGQTGNATAAGTFNLTFKVARTTGSADFYSINSEAWVMVL